MRFEDPACNLLPQGYLKPFPIAPEAISDPFASCRKPLDCHACNLLLFPQICPDFSWVKLIPFCNLQKRNLISFRAGASKPFK